MITFQYPGYNPTDSFSFHDPEKGDSKVPLEELFVHSTESGQYKSNAKVSCTQEYERSLSFVGLCKDSVEAFREFVKDSYGHYIRYTDYNGQSWMTQITDDVIVISETPYGYNIDMTLLVWEVT